MIRELTAIEGELDNYLDNAPGQSQYMKAKLLHGQDTPTQNQVFENTIRLNKDIELLKKKLESVNQQMLSSEETQKGTADNYVLKSELADGMRNVSTRQV